MSLSLSTSDAIINGIFDSDVVFYSIGGAVLYCIGCVWGFNQVMLLMDSSDSNSGGSPSKGSAEYYKARNEYNNSKRDSYSRWARSNGEK